MFVRWKKLKARYFWKGSYRDVKKFIGRCDKCQRKSTLKKKKRPLHSIPVETAFKQVGMDLIGPLVDTENGNLMKL